LVFKATPDYGPIDEKTFNEWAQWKAEESGGCRGIESTDTIVYQQNNIFTVISDKKGADNPGFVPDTEHMFSYRYASQLEGKGSFRKPKLLSSRNFDDNY